MEAVLADLSISISEFKKNPADVLRRADNRPVAVLSHNKTAFYMVPPAVMEALLEELEDADLARIVRDRLAARDTPIPADIDELERAARAKVSA